MIRASNKFAILIIVLDAFHLQEQHSKSSRMETFI